VPGPLRRPGHRRQRRSSPGPRRRAQQAHAGLARHRREARRRQRTRRRVRVEDHRPRDRRDPARAGAGRGVAASMALIHVPVELPAPGREIQPLPGLRVWRNALNGFVVIRTHYTADPARRGDWRLRNSPKYGGLRSWRWRKEQEIDPDAAAGRLVFEQYNPDVHVILPFTPPDHWPRWL